MLASLGDAERGRALMQDYGCGACHIIPGVPGARGLVGPSLEDYAARSLIAGQMRNRPAVLVRWLHDPTALIPESGMPGQGVTLEEAGHMARYLYTLGEGEVRDWPPDAPLDRRWFEEPDEP